MSSKSKRGVRKLVSVSATSMPVTANKKEAIETIKVAKSAGASKDGKKSEGKWLENLARVLYIRYPINCRKKSVLALFDSSSKVNLGHPVFAKELGLPIRLTNIGTQKIDSITLNTYGMVVAAFLMKDKAKRVRFFENTFLVTNISPEVVFRMLFLTLSGANIDFSSQKLCWRTYTTKEALSTTRRIELVGNKEFVAAPLDPKHEIYIVYVRLLISNLMPNSSPLDVYPSRRPQISGLIAEKALTKVSTKYSDFADVFSPDLTSKLPEHTGINDYAIELVDSQQSAYESIYSLRAVELETLKA